MSAKKKILLVSEAFYPELSPRSFRATELAKEFSRQGHTVVVITKWRNYEYADFVSDFNISLKMWSKSNFPKIPEFKIKPFSLLSRALSRLLLVLFEYPLIEEMFQVKKILKDENGYDLLISFSVPYPVHWGVAWSKSKKHTIAEYWIADCGDPYMGDILDSFRKLFYFEYLEKWFCRKANYISIPVESARPGYYPEFHDKIKIIPQGFDFELQKNAQEKTLNKVPQFAYAGGFLKGIRDPEPLLEFLTKTNLPFKFYVFTNQAALLDKFRNVLNEKLIISNYIDRIELMEILSKMDFLINFDNNTNRNIPSKLIDYAIAQRPVLNIDKNFKNDYILDFLNGNYENRMVLPDIEQYHIRNISKQFLDLNKD